MTMLDLHRDQHTASESGDEPGVCPRPALGRMTGTQLLEMEIEPVDFIVEGYIPEGLTILAGRPKLGKSWMALGLAVAVATGARAFGSVPVKKGQVLYLALEDNDRRLQQRLKQLTPEGASLDDLMISTECPRLDDGGLEAIREWAEAHERARMIIVDVFARVRQPRGFGDSGYESDYQALSPLKEIADEFGLAVLVIHHVRKMPAEDPFDTVSGTTGFTGAADTVLVIDRGSAGFTLYGRGRDIQEIDVAVNFDLRTGAWTVAGPAAEVRRSNERQEILALLEETQDPMSPADIAGHLGVPGTNVRQLLRKMTRDGEIRQAGRGKYTVTAPLVLKNEE